MTGQETNDHDHPHARTNLQGYAVTAAQKAELLAALDKAFDYRGDVTLTLTDGRTVEGYLFDRRPGKTLETSVVRMMPKDSADKLQFTYAQVSGIAFTGRDPAAGKSWETWVKKYVEKKTKGEKASIEAEPLEG